MGKVRKAKKVSKKVVERLEPEEEVEVEESQLAKKGMKRAAETNGPESSKKIKKTKAVEEEEEMDEETSDVGDVDDEEITDEELDDEEEEDSDDEDEEEEDESRTKEMMEDEATEFMNTDVEAFPIQEDDKEGIINILTQIFLRNGDVDVPALAEAIISQKPSLGSVIGPAEDETDEENTNMVYAMTSVLGIDGSQGDETPKYARSLASFINERADKYAVKDVAKHFSETLATKVGFLINERMLHFPTSIVAPSFGSLKGELIGLPKPYKNVLYIQKIRVADKEKEESAPGPSKSEGGKKKKKGKAEKKRLAAAALASAEIVFDNVEDAELFKLTAGKAHFFDYPVHNDIEAGSRFHIVEKDGKKFRPYRRAVLMDAKRFDAFVDALTSFSG